MADTEREEDLNPGSEDIEERVRQMLDPSVPDNPSPKSAKKSAKPITIQAVSDPLETTEVPSAPALETPVDIPKASNEAGSKTKKTENDEALPPSAKKSKKVIIPIDHQEGEAEDSKTEPADVKKITIADNADTPDEVAEKLDEAIAGLDPTAEKTETDQEELNGAAKEAEEPIDSTTEAEPEVPIEEPEVITDPATDKAVAEIVAAEGDEILEIEDAERAIEEEVKPAKKAGKKIAKKIAKKVLLIGVPVAIIALLITPNTRYPILNAAGVRASSSLRIIDETSGQPLKNAEVKLGNATGTTDTDGKVKLTKLRLGKNKLVVQKRAFANLDRTVTLGWGSNPLGDISLRLTGTQYSFKVTDFLSGKPVGQVTASTNETDALGNEEGLVKLSLEQPGEEAIKVILKRDGYRDEKINLDPSNTTEQAVKLVPARKHIYISKASGKFDVMSAYLDGKDQQVVLAGSGKEQDNLVLAPHPKDNVVAYISTRAGQTSKQGVTLSNLILIDLNDNTTTNIAASENIRLISWAGDNLVYVHMTADAGADATDRYKLMSYNYRENSNKELAKANFFNDVLGIGNTVYYALSSAYLAGSANLQRVNTDGTNNDILYSQEVWNIFRTAYDKLALSVQQEWYELRVGSKDPTKLNAAPAEQVSRVYIDSPSGKYSVWVDSRDGKGVLVIYDLSTKSDKVLQSLSGISYPVRWLNDSVIVYRVRSAQETADYAVSIDGGEPVKIRDVTNSNGLNRWLF